MPKTELIEYDNLPMVSSGSLEAYIAFVNSIPLLTPEEEYQLAENWRTSEDIASARYLIMSHLRLVVSVARGYSGYGIPLADIIQEGTIGLMKAVKKFDARRGVRLVTFSIYWIKAEIHEFIIKNWRIIKTVTTKNQRKLFFKLRSTRRDSGDTLSNEEAKYIASELNVPVRDVIEMNERMHGNDVPLFYESDNGEYDEYSEVLSDNTLSPERLLANKSDTKLQTEGIYMAVSQLDARSADIIKQRYLVNEDQQKTLQQLATQYNISAERIRQIEAEAMKTMRVYLTQQHAQ